MCEGKCALDEDKLEQLEKLLPSKVQEFVCVHICACMHVL